MPALIILLIGIAALVLFDARRRSLGRRQPARVDGSAQPAPSRRDQVSRLAHLPRTSRDPPSRAAPPPSAPLVTLVSPWRAGHGLTDSRAPRRDPLVDVTAFATVADQRRARLQAQRPRQRASHCPGRRARSPARSSRWSRAAPTTPPPAGRPRSSMATPMKSLPWASRSTPVGRPGLRRAPVRVAIDVPPGRRVAAAAEHRRGPFESDARLDRRRRRCSRGRRRTSSVGSSRSPPRVIVLVTRTAPPSGDRRLAPRRRPGRGSELDELVARRRGHRPGRSP